MLAPAASAISQSARNRRMPAVTIPDPNLHYNPRRDLHNKSNLLSLRFARRHTVNSCLQGLTLGQLSFDGFYVHPTLLQSLLKYRTLFRCRQRTTSQIIHESGLTISQVHTNFFQLLQIPFDSPEQCANLFSEEVLDMLLLRNNGFFQKRVDSIVRIGFCVAKQLLKYLHLRKLHRFFFYFPHFIPKV